MDPRLPTPSPNPPCPPQGQRTRHEHQHHQPPRRRHQPCRSRCSSHRRQHRRFKPAAARTAGAPILRPGVGGDARFDDNHNGASAHGDVDELVDVGDGRLHVRCVGAGESTVVLIAGFNDGGDNWGRITPALVRADLACAPTPASAPEPATRRPHRKPSRPRRAISTPSSTEIGEPGPYVVVGHSYGGAQAVTFAASYPAEVDGLLLLDATPPTWTAAGCAVPDDGSEAAADFVARLPRPRRPHRQSRTAGRRRQVSPRSPQSTASDPFRSAS